MTDCELKYFLKFMLEKLENDTITSFEKNALNDFYLELTVKKENNNDYLSNEEFMKLFYTTYFIFNNNKNDRNE
jgi:hypothetical protein